MNANLGFGFENTTTNACSDMGALVCDDSSVSLSCNVDLGFEIAPVSDVCVCPTGYFK
jgi:hypothetical protein